MKFNLFVTLRHKNVQDCLPAPLVIKGMTWKELLWKLEFLSRDAEDGEIQEIIIEKELPGGWSCED